MFVTKINLSGDEPSMEKIFMDLHIINIYTFKIERVIFLTRRFRYGLDQKWYLRIRTIQNLFFEQRLRKK